MTLEQPRLGSDPPNGSSRERGATNIPFVEALEKMPGYVKFMKDILSKKRKLGDYETVPFLEECNAILLKKLPPDEYIKYSSFTLYFN